MAIFPRRNPPPEPQDHYSKYRPFVREDFAECCAYCLFHEILAGGESNFQLDHFRPKSLVLFAKLMDDFYNLYYACSVCNRYKSVSWPPPELEALGYGFVDFCAEDFSTHFQEELDGSWSPLTLRAEYTMARIRLNRPHLLEIRRLLRELAWRRGIPWSGWEVRERARQLFKVV
jgi:hypothetical protein